MYSIPIYWPGGTGNPCTILYPYGSSGCLPYAYYLNYLYNLSWTGHDVGSWIRKPGGGQGCYYTSDYHVLNIPSGFSNNAHFGTLTLSSQLHCGTSPLSPDPRFRPIMNGRVYTAGE
jgi:hypothetical protein